jgi:hypothetical protein
MEDRPVIEETWWERLIFHPYMFIAIIVIQAAILASIILWLLSGL